jgi:hypothetical protein
MTPAPTAPASPHKTSYRCLEWQDPTTRCAGFSSRQQFQLVPRTGQPLYLVFGTGHPKGLEAMWRVDDSDGMAASGGWWNE